MPHVYAHSRPGPRTALNKHRAESVRLRKTRTTVDGLDTDDTAFTITGNGFTLAEIGTNFPRIENGSFVTQTFDLFTVTNDRLGEHAAERAAVLFGNDHILSDVHQTAGQVA